MPGIIISHPKEKLKMLSRILTISRLWGPLATVIFTVLYHYGALLFGYSITAIWLVLFLVTGSFIGGLGASLVCATWISLYALYAIPGDTSRIAQVAIGSFGIAVLVGWQTRRLREFYKQGDELFNGNAAKLRQALAFLRQAKIQLIATRKTIEASEDGLGNVMAGIVGYKDLRMTIEEVNDWFADPENVRRVQEMEAAKEERDQGERVDPGAL